MQNKTTQILRLLSPEEIKRFDKWLHSPWCNSNKKLPVLFLQLKKQYPHFEHSSLTKEKLFKKLYPAKSFDDKWFRNLLAALNQEAERFLQHERLNQSPALQKKLLLREYHDRQQIDWFEKNTRALIEFFQQKKGKTESDLFELSWLYEQLHRQPSAVARQLPEANALEQADQWLDQAYALTKARFLIEFSERNKIVAAEYDLTQQLAYLAQLNLNPPSVAVDFYLQLIAGSNQNQLATFLKLKKQFFKIAPLLHPKEQTIFLLLLINQASRLRSQGTEAMEKQILDLYKFGLDHELLLSNGHLTERTFTNLVVIANAGKEDAFAKKFIQDFSQKLPTNLQEDGKIWGLSYTSYTSSGTVDQDFERSLSQRKRDLTSFHLRSKSLLLTVYFDKVSKDLSSDGSFLLDYTYAFEKQLQREKHFPPQKSEAIKKRVQYVRKLYLLSQAIPLQVLAFEKLATQVQEEPVLEERQWLLEKIKQIKPRQP